MNSAKTIFYAALSASLSFTSVQAQVADYPFDINGAFEGEFVGSSGGYTGYNCEVTGNVVNGVPIAAQVSIAQSLLNGASGFVDSVNNDGRIKLTDGYTIRINDLNAIYSVGYTAQPFFTADDANPSISSFSGFPMCAPRSAADALCPQFNRPDVTPGVKQGLFKAPDALVMAPIVAGDFVEYSGVQSGSEIIVYNLVVSNVQITTTGVPTYIRMEDANIGFVGYTSDSAANVNPIKIYAIEYDPCTGEAVDREIAGVSVPGTEVRNKFEYRIKATQNDNYAREYRVVAGTGTVKTKNGVLAGQYVMPVSEWIQPEDSVPGRPPSPHDFRSYAFLTKGLGRDAEGNLWGPLNPFPQTGAILYDSSKCPAATTPTTGTGTGTGTGSGTTTTPATAASSSAAAVKYKDVVTMPTFNWVSSQSGTLTVGCQSNSTDDAAVAMKLSYTNKDGTTTGLAMTSGGKGLWNFNSNKIKQPTTGTVICKIGLGGQVAR
ncbi:hypothetical protein BDP81DRAFT_411276 [Colletotrichum phormii]|uniref:Ig-like domain-containing protein n=1 Tax=Colletotrichum phormii TaxID=359342 RepID=A0AAI9ZF42_9PEZI|nr:uncharacterized protein BDP81DRAFT_411276 [Colletotrichum phormii]KAK1622435.1 hypothetical protein BDP81DRAFT_411276 [Colletotrichum phormii]